MKNCKAFLDAAAKAPGLDPDAAERVKFLQYGLTNMELTMAAQVEYRKYKAGAPILPFAKAVKKLDNFRASIEHTNALNMGNIRMVEDRVWPMRAAIYTKQTEHVNLADWKILFDPRNIGLKEKWQLPSADHSKAVPVRTNDGERKRVNALREKQYGKKTPNTVWYFNELKNVKIRSGRKMQFMFSYVYGNAEIFLNRKLIFSRKTPGDFTWWSWKDTFFVDIPEGLLKPAGNLLAVRVDSQKGIAGIWLPVRVLYNK